MCSVVRCGWINPSRMMESPGQLRQVEPLDLTLG
jgi:hypothetical protein